MNDELNSHFSEDIKEALSLNGLFHHYSSFVYVLVQLIDKIVNLLSFILIN